MQMKVEIIVYSPKSIERMLGFLKEDMDADAEAKIDKANFQEQSMPDVAEQEEPKRCDMEPHFKNFECMQGWRGVALRRRLDACHMMWDEPTLKNGYIAAVSHIGASWVATLRKEMFV